MPIFSAARHGGRWPWMAVGVVVILAAALLIALQPGRDVGGSGILPAVAGPGAPVAGETYSWRPVAIGAGGFITGLSISDDGRSRVARTDVHGAYLWDAERGRWSQLVTNASMPEADRVQAGMNAGAYEAVVAPGDANRFYLAIKGRFYRSDDRGQSWTQPAAGAPFPLGFDANSEFRLAGPFIAVSPDDPDLVLLGTPEAGLWRSADGGRAWTRVGDVPAAADLRPAPGVQAPGIVVRFVRDGGGRARIVAASAGHGLFLSDDGGRSFAPLPSSGPAPVTVARLDPGGHGDLFAVDTEAQKAWRYHDGAWTDLTAGAGLPAARFAGVAADPRGDAVFVTDAGGPAWCSPDGGDRWVKVTRAQTVERGGPAYLHVNDGAFFASGQILFDPAVANRLWVAAGIGPYRADTGGGCTSLRWTTQLRGIEELVANDAVQPPGGAPLFAAWDFGIHRKTDLDTYSTSYGPKERSLIAAQQVDWSGHHPAFLVTNASDTRMGCCAEDGDSVLAGYSEDGGMSWHKFASLPQPPGTEADDPWRMAFGTIAVAAGRVDDIVWEPAFNRSPFYTQDRGVTWHRVVLPGEVLPLTGSYPDYYNGRKTLAADRVLPATFYLVHSGEAPNAALAGVWRSDDGGAHWRRVFAGEIAPNSGGPARLRVMPDRSGNLFFTSAVAWGPDTRLRRSIDGGAHWQALDGVDHVDDIGFGKAARGARVPAIYISGQVGGRYGIWRSVDDAASWQRLAGFPLGRLDQVSVVEADKDVFGRVYVGYSGSGWLYGVPAPCRAAPFRAGDDSACEAVTAAGHP